MNRAQRRNISKSKNPADVVRLGEFYRRNGQINEAERKYREAVALRPDLALAHNNLGDILHETGRLAEATEHFVSAFRITPKDSTVVINLARALYAQAQLREAGILFREAISLQPLSAVAHFGLALTLRDLGEYAESEVHYVKALAIEPLHWHGRISLGMVLVDQEKIAEAFAQAEILARAESATDFPHKSFGILLARAGCLDGARHCFETHLLANLADEDEIAMLLAAVGGALPKRASDQQILKLYDASRAGRWDQGTTGPTGYQGHQLVFAAIDELSAHRVNKIVDAGCGTGLVGELVRVKTDHLAGVDMSEAMLDQARQKNIYDELHRGDLLEYLNRNPRSCDIISSAATLIHFGDLDPVFGAAARCLRPDGLFVFTVFPNNDSEAVTIGTLNGLAQGGCFLHGSGYVTKTAAKHRFRVELLRHAPHEYIRKASIPGLVVALRLKDSDLH